MKKLILLSASIFLIAGLSFAQTYVGPERCLQCHNNPGLGDATGWRSSFHANGYSYVPDDARSLEDRYGVVADYDNNSVSFILNKGGIIEKVTLALEKNK